MSNNFSQINGLVNLSGSLNLTGSFNINGASGMSISDGTLGLTTGAIVLNSGSYIWVQDTGYITSSYIYTNGLNVSGSLNITGSTNIVSGSITMPNRPAFRVNGAGGPTSATTVLSGSMTVVDYNQGNAWNNSNGTFTAPIAGLYQVNLVARCNSNSSPTAQVIVYKNNTTISPTNGIAQIMLEWAANTTANHVGGSTISKLAVGDTLKVVVTVGTISFDENDNFSVAYIG